MGHASAICCIAWATIRLHLFIKSALNWGSVEMTNRSKKQPDRDCFLALSPVKFQSLVGFPRGGTFFGDSDSFLKESVKERNS